MNGATGNTIRVVGGLAFAAGLTLAAPVGCASAQPPGFPDLNSFTLVPVEDYFMGGQHGSSPESRGVAFSTPYSVNCTFEAPLSPQPGRPTGVFCYGDVPGMSGTESLKCPTGNVDGAGPAGGYQITPQSGNCSPFVEYGKQLGVGQKVAYRNVTCAVGADQLIACLDTNSGHHGFVLKPSGSDVF
jgi:hypothetical protein